MRENSTLYWLLSDHLGSTAITANSSGSRTAELRYKAYGETRYSWGTTPTTYRFTGQREEATIGLYFYNARWYDPVLGRFVQPDTIVPEPGNPQSLNRYAYVYNNPLRYTDPSGRRPTSGCEYEGCSLRPGLPPESTWQLPDGTQLPYDPQLAAAYGNSPLLDPQTAAIVQTAVGFLCEWCDWGMTFYAWSQGDFSWWDLAGLLPILPAAGVRSARHADEVADVVKRLDKDLYAFGNRAGPRPPRPGKDVIPDANGMLAPQVLPDKMGASTFADPNQAPLRGHYHRLPAGTELPDGLDVVADGLDVDLASHHPPTHHTIFNTVEMALDRFVDLFLNLPWQYGGKK